MKKNDFFFGLVLSWFIASCDSPASLVRDETISRDKTACDDFFSLRIGIVR